MSGLFDILECPFCAAKFRLGDLPIVATSQRQVHKTAGLGFGDGDVAAEEQPRPRSGSKPLGWVGGWPVVAPAPLAAVAPATGLRRLAGRPPPRMLPLDQAAPPEDRPARVCLKCKQPLPRSLDSRDWFTIAVVGVNFASKTHFIATALHEAYYNQGLRDIGCRTFEPDGPSGEIYHRDYFIPVFEDKRVMEGTQSDLAHRTRRFAPLVFQASFANAQRGSLLLFHDVAGEDVSGYNARPLVAPFVARADAIIFLLDPHWLPALRGRLTSVIPSPGVEQMQVFSSVLDDLTRNNVPTIIALTKSDLLRPLIGSNHPIFRPAPPGGENWLADLRRIDQVVRDLLEKAGARLILAKAESLQEVSFCAISPIGSDPGGAGNPIFDIEPIRVLDPIVAALSRIPELGIRGGE